MKICYYYQTFTGLDKIIKNNIDTDVVIVSSLHFGINKLDSVDNFYIHLNDKSPYDSLFNQLWTDTELLNTKNKTIMFMLGGAGGAYTIFFQNFEVCYKLLIDLIKSKPFIKGIDLDIEEFVNIEDVKKLINRLVVDMGVDFVITMAPVGSSLQRDIVGMGGFKYKDLYLSNEGKYIHWFNVQCYNGTFNYNVYNSIIENHYPAEKIVMGMMSGDYDKSTFHIALNEIKKIKSKYPTFGGVFDWEYLDAPPVLNDPSQWGTQIKNIFWSQITSEIGN